VSETRNVSPSLRPFLRDVPSGREATSGPPTVPVDSTNREATETFCPSLPPFLCVAPSGREPAPTIASTSEPFDPCTHRPRATTAGARMARRIALAFGILAATTAACFFTATAHAQPAFAIGKPLPDGNVPTGTVVVRVIAGSSSAPEVGADVTLVVNGTPRQARTDASGRATFAGLAAGATVVAKILDADKKEISADPFPIPSQGGTRVMLTTKPLSGVAMAPPASGGAGSMGGMPEARMMSGQPRPDGGELPGVYSVRVTYNNLQMGPNGPFDPDPPTGAVVHLVGYAADDSINVQTKTVDDKGVARFEALDQSGATSYFAMSSLKRGDVLDRMVSVTVVLDGQSGVRVVLSGEKRDSTKPAVDDYEKLVPRDGRRTDAGKVRISLDGVAQLGQEVTLFDAKTRLKISSGKTEQGAPDPTQIRGGANFVARTDLPAGTVEVMVAGGVGDAMDPMKDVTIQLIVPEEAQTPIVGAAGTTDATGKTKVAIPAGFKLPEKGVVAKVTINGKDMFSSPMDLSTSGGLLELSANWPKVGKPEALLDATTSGLVVYAETTYSGTVFRSLPFEILPGTGMAANIYIYPRTLFSFDTHSFVEDQLLAVQGTFEITNYSWAPHRATNDGLLIKLPARYKGAVIAPQDQKEVAVDTAQGFRILRPIPPGGRKFRAGFSMPIENGTVNWKFDMPMGSWNSAMRIRQTPGMKVTLPKGVEGSTQKATTGEPWFVMENITIERKQSFVMTISGFPAEAQWKIWVPRIVGIAVLFMVLAGLGYALTVGRRQPMAADTSMHREKLMTELVELEKRGIATSKDRHRREQLIDELERSWGS
jgi:hypothetical protein